MLSAVPPILSLAPVGNSTLPTVTVSLDVTLQPHHIFIEHQKRLEGMFQEVLAQDDINTGT